ncbi:MULTISPECIES: BlaI/MecI/CopY family transcriptional regulator [Streptomyces]|uniref:BlaI/MecI/CopY family transcriptional regulator n=1 Tax=Streptomyces TaxID=1883 RepID=UPI00081B2EF6|nr:MULTISPECIES: BlaI/MecI/CopY family transcriptional regulator [Streptomyces]MCW8218895.1 BlaI/MecI/CopY family transcriptional regulator [Streptomyces griseolus]MYQ55223.1 BlaI/MecI/CopY family transcriptional regulator [Streptomyces sp. SID4941]SCE34555.1 Predicted transcriptional regulator [Streptomyces sp. PalvLS-984]SDD19190.1 Predicted transcriptional regulator [Streptomyces sp. AmelKG-A3]
MTDTVGERRPAGELEASVLAALCAAGRAQSAAEVRAAIPQKLARTTVATLLTRLYEKGAVGRTPGRRGFLYVAVADSHGLTARRMRQELEQDDDRSVVLARFVEGLDPADEAELKRLLGGGDH